MYRYLLAIMIVTLAAGCSGSDRRATIEPANDAAARVRYDRILTHTNLVLDSGNIGYRRRGSKLYVFGAPGTCEGESCAEVFSVEDISLQILRPRRGVSRVNESFEDAERRNRVYGGWMNDSFFAVQADQFLNRHSHNYRGLYGMTVVSSYAVGFAPGTNPDLGTLNGRWTGLMFGVDLGVWPNRGDVLSGDATVAVELSGTGMQADVLFTDIADQLDVPRPDMTWEDLNVEAGRFGHDGGLLDNLAGAFFGVGHGEVAGTFHRDLIVGSFGGVRN